MFTDSDFGAVVGTSSPIYMPPDGPESTAIGGYIAVQLIAARVAFRGRFWETASSVVVSTTVTIDDPRLGGNAVHGVHRVIPVGRHGAEHLGYMPMLIGLTPATFPQFSVHVEFVLDRQNRLAGLEDLVDGQTLAPALSFDVAGLAAAKAIAPVAKKLIKKITTGGTAPLLRFAGDFILSETKAGTYAILGSTDKDHPLPLAPFRLSISDGTLLMNGTPCDVWSYVILRVWSVTARGRRLGQGRRWELRLRDAETAAFELDLEPAPTSDAREAAWTRASTALKEAQILLLADPDYLPDEARNIVKAAYQQCGTTLFRTIPTRGITVHSDAWPERDRLSRALLDISPNENVATTLARYAAEVIASRSTLSRIAGTT